MKQETILYYAMEDMERFELEVIATCLTLALGNPALVVDRPRWIAANEIREKIEERLAKDAK